MGNLPITDETWSNATLDDWKEEFWKVYSEPDLARNLHQTWSMVYEDAAGVGEAIRENKLENCVKYLAHTFCWIASFIKKLDCDGNVPECFKKADFEYQISNIVLYKYPGICPHCLEARCRCSIVKPEEKRPKAERRAYVRGKWESFDRKGDPNGWSVDTWQKHFQNIYDPAHDLLSLNELGFHLLEETGEVQEAIRRIATKSDCNPGKIDKDTDLKEELIEEVADCVSWCFSIILKIAKGMDKAQKLQEVFEEDSSEKTGKGVESSLTFSKVLWCVYQRKTKDDKGRIIELHKEVGCPVCDERPCKLTNELVENIRWNVDTRVRYIETVKS